MSCIKTGEEQILVSGTKIYPFYDLFTRAEIYRRRETSKSVL